MSAATAQSSLLATRRGKLILVLLCSVLDFVDVTIVNVALPSIRHGLQMSVQNLQWIPSVYLLAYGGFMLLGGRAATCSAGAVSSSPGRPCSASRRSWADWPAARASLSEHDSPRVEAPP